MNPLETVISLAEENEWEYTTPYEHVVEITVEAQWKTYTIVLRWLEADQTLGFLCICDVQPPEAKVPLLYEVLNVINNDRWTGAFSYNPEKQYIQYRLCMTLSQEIDTAMCSSLLNGVLGHQVQVMEEMLPVINQVVWSGTAPRAAYQERISSPLGTA